MDYETALDVFFKPSPPGVPAPDPVANARPPRRLRDATEPLAMHAVWSRSVNERLAQVGLNFLTGYVWGRAAALGEPPASLVASAFAVFEPGLIGSLYEEGRSRCGRAALLRTREKATIESLQRVLGRTDVTSVVATLRRGLDAADGTGRPLFAGLLSLGWPEEPLGQLWRACDLLREHRGDSHVAACISAGLGPVAMNVLTELWIGMPLGSYSATRAWPADVTDATVAKLRADGLVADGALTDAGRRLRDGIEERTDAMEQPIVEAIGDDFGALVTQLDDWSADCVEAGAFPPDIFKRAAG